MWCVITAGEKLTYNAIAYLEEHSNEKLSLREIASALYVNGSYLLRTFKLHTGQTLLSYHNYLRCEKAKHLLADPNRPVGEIGEEAGFVSSAHFSHVFKKLNGISPTQYRDSLINYPEEEPNEEQ